MEESRVAESPPCCCRISRAAIRRLAHDAGARLSKHTYEEVCEGVNEFLRRLLEKAVMGMRYGKKRSLAVAHVAYAVTSITPEMPEELRNLQRSQLTSLVKCNVKAPAATRRYSSMCVEISEASMGRVLRALIDPVDRPLRITTAAQRYCHLLAEAYIIRFYMVSAPPEQVTPFASVQAGIIASAFGCRLDEAVVALDRLHLLLGCVLNLLKISNAKTIDEAGVDIAMKSLNWSTTAADITLCPGARKVMERMVRGGAANKRVTHAAAHKIALCIGAALREASATAA